MTSSQKSFKKVPTFNIDLKEPRGEVPQETSESGTRSYECGGFAAYTKSHERRVQRNSKAQRKS